jgi:transposase-like protein
MHVPRDQNTKANILARLVSTRNNGVTHSFIQETLEISSIAEKTPVCAVTITPTTNTWIKDVKRYILKGGTTNKPLRSSLNQKESREPPHYWRPIVYKRVVHPITQVLGRKRDKWWNKVGSSTTTSGVLMITKHKREQFYAPTVCWVCRK